MLQPTKAEDAKHAAADSWRCCRRAADVAEAAADKAEDAKDAVQDAVQ